MSLFFTGELYDIEEKKIKILLIGSKKPFMDLDTKMKSNMISFARRSECHEFKYNSPFHDNKKHDRFLVAVKINKNSLGRYYIEDKNIGRSFRIETTVGKYSYPGTKYSIIGWHLGLKKITPLH